MAAGIQRGRPDGRGARAAPGRAVSYNAVGLSTCGREACAVGEKAVMAASRTGRRVSVGDTEHERTDVSELYTPAAVAPPQAADANGAGLGLTDSIYNRLLKERIIWLGSECVTTTPNAICAQMLLLAPRPERTSTST